MKKTFGHFLLVFLSIFLFSQCAKKGTPNGGAKDTIPPVIVKSTPENYTTNFTGNEIRIYFDEYIKLKELQNNLIISPPLQYQPVITPSSTSKILKIKILDTLKENTTYAFSFGKSIVDNNEENPYDYYKYIFSTGSYIDSLTLSGKIDDALLLEPNKQVTVLLYERNETFTDSILFKEKPTYVAVTKDSTHNFELTNLKEGSYLLAALQEENNDYIFQPEKDKIGFLKQTITIPTDSSYTLRVFKEEAPYRMTRPSHVSKHKIIFGYEGNIDSLKLTPLFQTPEDYETKIYRNSKIDSINYFFKPAFDIEQQDTLYFLAQKQRQEDTLIVKLRDLFADSLKITQVGRPSIIPRDTLQLRGNNPLVSFTSEKITVLDKDSTNIPATTYIDTTTNVASVLFEKEDDQQYTVEILPEALTDFFENTNDTLQYRLATQAVSEYGTITFTLQNAKQFPLILQLVDTKFKVIESNYLTTNEPSYFDYLKPDKYYMRIIYDRNENKKWDTGNYLKKIQPEEVIYYPSQIEVRANWSLPETFILD